MLTVEHPRTPRHLIDLDDVAGLERAWFELERLRAIRRADPELRATILRRAEHLSPADRAIILGAMDEMHPEAVLATYFGILAPNRPTLGAILRGVAARRPTPAHSGLPRSPAAYIKVRDDMAAAGLPDEVVASAVADMACEDGLSLEALEAIRRPSA